MKAYLIARLGEPSTWQAIVVAFSILGWNLLPEQQQAIATLGGLIFSAIGAGTKG